jgi:hypothetical protein
MTSVGEYSRLVLAGVNSSTAGVLALGRDEQHRRRRRAELTPDREHGSERGYRQHQTHDERSCAPCRAAHGRYNDEHSRRTTA